MGRKELIKPFHHLAIKGGTHAYVSCLVAGAQGGQKKRFKDTLKASLKASNINHNTWKQSAQDRGTWRSAVHKGAKACEANRTAVAEERRQARKNRATNPATAATIPCPHCQRLFRARIGLTSHLRTHRAQLPQPQDD